MPLFPIFPGGTGAGDPTAPAQEANDALAKDEKVPLSKIMHGAGFRGQALKDAMALTFPESGANPNAENTDAPCSKKGDRAVGLLQICTVHRGKFGIPRDMDKAVAWLKNPHNNAKVAYRLWLSAGRTFSKDWAAWGQHQGHYGKDPLITVGKNTVTGEIADVADAALGPFDELASAVLSPSTWFRIGKGWLGGVFIITGTGALVFIVANRASGGALGQTAKAAAKTAVTKKPTK